LIAKIGQIFYITSRLPLNRTKLISAIKESLSCIERDAPFASRKRLLHIEESLSFFTVSYPLLTKHCLATLHKTKNYEDKTRYLRFNVYICCRQNNTY